MGELLFGCSGWNYPDSADKGGWTGVFYPNKNTERLRYYSQFFNTAEMDSFFYDKFYSDAEKGAIALFEAFVDKISLLKTGSKLGAILFQLPPNFTDNDFKNIERFLDRLPTDNGCDCAMKFRHPSWGTEGPWEMLKHYIIAVTVMTDSPIQENLQFLPYVIVTANHLFIRFHRRNIKGHYWYNCLYSEQEIEAWVEKVSRIRKQIKPRRVYFNNHYGGKAVINAMQFKNMIGVGLAADERKVLEHA
jgi:uncharacterized protein YecE (DUF72 family)